MTGTVACDAAAVSSSKDPEKASGSVSTEIMAAPPRS